MSDVRMRANKQSKWVATALACASIAALLAPALPAALAQEQRRGQSRTISETGRAVVPAVRPTHERFACPTTKYLDCMPPTQNRPLCTADYIRWASSHCLGFEVVY